MPAPRLGKHQRHSLQAGPPGPGRSLLKPLQNPEWGGQGRELQACSGGAYMESREAWRQEEGEGRHAERADGDEGAGKWGTK